MLLAFIKKVPRPDDFSENRILEIEVAEEAVVGEIIVTGNALSSGYWTVDGVSERDPKIFVPRNRLPPALQELSKSHPEITSDFWFTTGDLSLLEEGHLYITSRIKEVIVIRGRNYVATDIEHTVMTSVPEARPGCIAAVAISGSDYATEEALLLCETRSHLPDRKAKGVIGEIRRYIREVHGINASVALLEKGSLPKTSSGKLRRMKAAELWKMGSLKPSALVSASAPSSLPPPTVDEPTIKMVSHEVKASRDSQSSNLEPAEATEPSESLAWDFSATFSDRFSALHAQIRRITKVHLDVIGSSSDAKICYDITDVNTEWPQLGLDSLSAVLIMQDLQDEANKILKEHSNPIVLSPNLLYEDKDIKSLIQHLISLHGFEDGKTIKNMVTHETLNPSAKLESSDKAKKIFEHAIRIPHSMFFSTYFVFATAQAFWTCFMWSTIMYTARLALSFVGEDILGLSTVILPLIHFCFIFSLAIATVMVKKSVIGVYQPGCHPQYGEFH